MKSFLKLVMQSLESEADLFTNDVMFKLINYIVKSPYRLFETFDFTSFSVLGSFRVPSIVVLQLSFKHFPKFMFDKRRKIRTH